MLYDDMALFSQDSHSSISEAISPTATSLVPPRQVRIPSSAALSTPVPFARYQCLFMPLRQLLGEVVPPIL
jgi:hypothetical protein